MAVKLSSRTRDHIRQRHPEITAYLDRIAATAREPDLILRAITGEYKAVRLHEDLPLRAKYLVAVYRQIGEDKVIITSYLTSEPSRIKGEVVWRRRP